MLNTILHPFYPISFLDQFKTCHRKVRVPANFARKSTRFPWSTKTYHRSHHNHPHHKRNMFHVAENYRYPHYGSLVDKVSIYKKSNYTHIRWKSNDTHTTHYLTTHFHNPTYISFCLSLLFPSHHISYLLSLLFLFLSISLSIHPIWGGHKKIKKN